MDQCTFKPKTNDVNDQAMPAAAMYVRAPIFDRLARTHTHAQKEREASRGDVESKGSHSPEDSGTRVDPETRKREMEQFYARQQAAEMKRHQTVARLQAELAPVAQPELCTKSLEMAEASRTGSFLERVANEAARKEHESLKSKARLARDPECTFKPTINPASKHLPGRSTVELSRGDQLKRETAVRLMRLRAEAEQLEGITFAPNINARSKYTQSRLRIAEDPETYVQRLQVEAAVMAEKARKVSEEIDRKALSECTFKPAIHDAPDYVKRIARSMALSRAVRPPESGIVKPEWK
jgi:hypothetical protein